ncbi:MAG: D-aminoacyl-tRNA deacylase [Kiritimatiellia bacterium]|jgi:D-tyrosyl-tRNA(Tyr) deacylase|uniref:D-aminoacyl-tRNA deacylase n=1 Tax=Atribacter sp. TaxID=2847780 RepID=UPI003D9536C4
MKLIVQRVSQASVVVDGGCVGAVGAGFMVLVGCRFDDTVRDVEHLAAKLAALRIFEDEAGKMNLSIEQTGGSVLLVPQFTLYADTRKGNRPSFILSGDPARAKALFERFVETMRNTLGADKVATGVFGAEMKVSLVNEGPVTIELCSDGQPWRSQSDSKTTTKS